METRRNRRNPWGIVLLIVLMTCMAAYGAAYLFTRVLGQDTFGHYRVMPIENLQKLKATADGFVYYDGSAVSCVDSAGRTKWSYMVGANADFSASNTGVAA